MSRTRFGCVLEALWAGRIAAALLSDLMLVGFLQLLGLR